MFHNCLPKSSYFCLHSGYVLGNSSALFYSILQATGWAGVIISFYTQEETELLRDCWGGERKVRRGPRKYKHLGRYDLLRKNLPWDKGIPGL